MEDIDLLKMAGFSTTGFAIVMIVYRVLKTIQGKRLVSNCCGKRMEVGVAVETMTPTPTNQPPAIVVHNPMHN